MTWLPNGVVTIGGVAYTAETLWGVSISYGRTDVWEQARTGFANVQILNTNNTLNLFNVNDTIVITLEDSIGAPVTMFTGIVTDIANRIQVAGEIGHVVIQTITAVSQFAFMSRKVIGSTAYPIEYDDDRMLEIFTEAGVNVDLIDTPGVYEFEARAGSASDAYSLAAQYAQMAFGYIYETTDGKVGYANESHRLNEVQSFGYFTIPNSYILASGVSSTLSLSNLTNDVLLSYASGSTVTATDAASIAAFGLQAASISTQLNDATEAQYQADRYVTLRSFPQVNLSSFAVQLNSSLVLAADLDIFLGLYMGKPVQMLDLPIPIINGVYKGFVEGWNLNFNQYEAQMTITTTDSSLSIIPTRWQDVDPAQEWLDVDPTVQWFAYE